MPKAQPLPKKPVPPPAVPTLTPSAPATQSTEQLALAAEIDELGELEKQFAPHKFKLSRIEQLRAAIRARFDDAPAFKAEELHGQKYILQLGQRGKVSMINMPKLFKAIGAKLFVAVASTTLKALGEHVTPDIVAAVVTVEQTGPRSIKTFEKGTGAA